MSTDPATTALLSSPQQTAIEHIRAHAGAGRRAALEEIAEILRVASSDHSPQALLRAVAAGGGVALNFHPDRLIADGRMVVETLLADGVYRNQFETNISNGGLSAFAGGDRDHWENRLFGLAYQGGTVTARERPKYGGLNLMNHPDGPCPRFGSCHLRLRPEVVHRATYCFGDSHLGPNDIGTIDAFEPVLAALLEGAHVHRFALGVANTTVQTVVEILEQSHQAMPPPTTPNGRALDDYIEVQVHGPVRLAEDVEAIVADPSFDGTPVGQTLAGIATRYELDLHWHRGFELNAVAVPPEFRGPAIPVIAERIARDFGDGSGLLHAELIGRAARSVVTDPGRWQDRGTPAETLQHIKQLWHVLVRYGD